MGVDDGDARDAMDDDGATIPNPMCLFVASEYTRGAGSSCSRNFLSPG